MTSHKDIGRMFADGETKGKASRMFIEGDVVYSYGTHFPIAKRQSNGMYLFNTDGYSSSTSSHKSYVRECLAEDEIIECTTKEIKRAISYPNRAVIIERWKDPESISHALSMLKTICKEKGMKSFLRTMIQTFLEERIEMQGDHKHTIVFGNQLSIKHSDTWSDIKFKGKTVRVTHKWAGYIADQMSMYSNVTYSRKCLELIRRKVSLNKELHKFVEEVMRRKTLPLQEEFEKIDEENKLVKDI